MAASYQSADDDTDRITHCFVDDPQQCSVVCIGGQGTVPYEQNTQQSPFLGRSSEPQPAQS